MRNRDSERTTLRFVDPGKEHGGLGRDVFYSPEESKADRSVVWL